MTAETDEQFLDSMEQWVIGSLVFKKEHRDRLFALARRGAQKDAVFASLGQFQKLSEELSRLRVQNIQMQAALGYAICVEDERHIIPSNPYKCGVCDANKGIHDEITRLRAALRDEPTPEQVYNACLSYRHDFGLLSLDERKIVAFTATEWLRAWQKTLDSAALEDRT